MNYVSIDIETTGLDPDKHQILQVGMVIDGHSFRERPVEELPAISVLIKHDAIVGEPYALAMNVELLRRIDRKDSGALWPCFADKLLESFLADHLGDDIKSVEGRRFLTEDQKVIAAGKNFAGFDRQFMRRHLHVVEKRFRHRSLDPAILFLQMGEDRPPSLGQCLERAGLPAVVSHDAVADARQVCALLRQSPIVEAIYAQPVASHVHVWKQEV